MRWRVTERHGSEVTKGKFDTLDEALEHARDRVDAALREGRLGTVSMLREFTPDQRVQSRVEISAARLFAGPEAGHRRDGRRRRDRLHGRAQRARPWTPTRSTRRSSVRDALAIDLTRTLAP